MRIDAKLDVAKLVDKTTKAQRNLAYSVVQGLNATARQIQDAQRAELRKTFTLRTENTQRFLTRQIAIIKPFASVPAGRLWPKSQSVSAQSYCSPATKKATNALRLRAE